MKPRLSRLLATTRAVVSAAVQEALPRATEQLTQAVELARQFNAATPRQSAITEAGAEPPVVARLLVEIRSDGSHTIARGALQDELTGEKIAIEAHGASPLELAAQLTKQLAKTVISAPFAIASARAALLTGKTTLTGKKEQP